jgi:hypothetical protein
MDHQDLHTRYFLSFKGYDIPFRPSQEVPDSIALERKTYYIGRYAQDLLISFEKLVQGRRMFLDEYQYWPGSEVLQHRRMTKDDSTVMEQVFDRRGKLL